MPIYYTFSLQDLINIQIWLTLFSVWFYFSRPINLSQRARPAAFTVMTKCVMAHQSPRPLIRCCGGQMKVPSANREMAQGTARPKSPTLFELKTVSQYLGVVHWLFLKIFVYILGMQPYHLFFRESTSTHMYTWALIEGQSSTLTFALVAMFSISCTFFSPLFFLFLYIEGSHFVCGSFLAFAFTFWMVLLQAPANLLMRTLKTTVPTMVPTRIPFRASPQSA